MAASSNKKIWLRQAFGGALVAQKNRWVSQRLSFQDVYGGGRGIRTPVGLHPNGFQDRPVMTTSVSLRIFSTSSNIA